MPLATDDRPDEKLNPAKNPGDAAWRDEMKRRFDEDQREAAIQDLKKGEKLDAHGDKIQKNYNADETDDNGEKARDGEKKGDEIPNHRGEGKKRTKGFLSKLKKLSAAGGVTAILVGSFSIASVVTMPAALIVMMEKIFTNANTHDTRANHMMSRARYGALFGADKDCSGAKIKCKVKSMSSAEIKRWKATPGVEVKEGRSVFGRKIITGMTVTGDDGKTIEIRNANDFNKAMRDNDGFKRTAWRMAHPKATFFIDKTSKFRSVLKKYKLSLGNAFKSSTKKDKSERKAENNKKMDEKTGAATADEGGGGDGKSRADEEREAKADMDKAEQAANETEKLPNETDEQHENRKKGLIQSAREGYRNRMNSIKSKWESGTSKVRAATTDKIKAKLSPKIQKLSNGKAAKSVKKAVGASSIIALGCAAKSIIKGSIAIIKLQYYMELFRFMFPFMQAAAQIADRGDIDPETVEYIGDRLTWYDNSSEEKAKADRGDSESKYGLTATDSQGFQAALYGQFDKLKEFTKQYVPSYIVGAIAGQGVIDEVEKKVGGKENLRKICMGSAAVSTLGLAQCLNPVGFFVCAAGMALMYVFADDILGWITGELTETAIERIANADLNSGLAGVDLGNAIAAGIGLFLMEKSRGSGLTAATSVAAVNTYLSGTEEYYRDYIAMETYDAKKEPFNPYNQYSFAGKLVAGLNQYKPQQSTVFSTLSNIASVITLPFGLLKSTASAGYYQPIESVNNSDALNSMTKGGNGRLSCQDEQLNDIGALCDWSGRTIDVVGKQVIDWAKNMENGGSDTWDHIVDKMGKNGWNYIEDSGKPVGYDGYPEDPDPDNYEEEYNSSNDYLMFKAYCTEDRVYPIGTTTYIGESIFSNPESGEREMLWHNGDACLGKDADGKDDQELLEKLNYFSFYYNMCETQLGQADENQKCWEDEPAEGGSGNSGDSSQTPQDGEKGCENGDLSGDAKTLAKKILDCNNIKFQTPAAESDIKHIADTGNGNCDNKPADITILKYLLYGANRFKITVGTSSQSHGCDSGPHGHLGMGVDINGIKPKDQEFQQMFGASHWAESDEPNIKSFQEYIGGYAKPGRLEFGQSDCWTTTQPPQLPGQASGGQFSDTCHHVHMDSTNYWITSKWPEEVDV